MPSYTLELELFSLLNPTTSDFEIWADGVQLTTGGGNTTISVDANGTTGGAVFSNVAVVNGVTGLDVDFMVNDGTLII